MYSIYVYENILYINIYEYIFICMNMYFIYIYENIFKFSSLAVFHT